MHHLFPDEPSALGNRHCHGSLPPYAAMMSLSSGGCFVTNASPKSLPMSAPKCRPRASIMSRNFFDEMNVCGSFDFGLWNCDLNAAMARIFVFQAAETSTTKLGGNM